MRNITLSVVAIMALMTLPASAESVEDNLQRMLEAARGLSFEDPPARAFLLEKLATMRSPVAVVFGYADNAAACDEVASALSASGTAGTFQCSPIY